MMKLLLIAVAMLCLAACENSGTDVTASSRAPVQENVDSWSDVERAMGLAKAQEQPVKAPPVSSLIARLEQRVLSDSAAADDWVLLAQSYEFTGQPDKAREAAHEAVQRGADEATVRHLLRRAVAGANL